MLYCPSILTKLHTHKAKLRYKKRKNDISWKSAWKHSAFPFTQVALIAGNRIVERGERLKVVHSVHKGDLPYA
jgi:hypothetical protein